MARLQLNKPSFNSFLVRESDDTIFITPDVIQLIQLGPECTIELHVTH